MLQPSIFLLLVHYRLDWSQSEVGLFFGLFALVTLTITLILYFSLVSQVKYQLIAVLVINITDTIINLAMIIATIIGFVQVRNLSFHSNDNEHDSLLVVGALGESVLATVKIFILT